ncbi:MAG: LrgB family protein [Oscillospiraceae bacterium]|nr:LrgB family protein [Oscillospiraceae bacterium]
MTELLQIGILPVVLTLFAYQMGLLCQKKFKVPVFNPILIGMIIVIAALKLTGLPTGDYQNGVKLMSWLMTPATVCLAIPMYEQIQALRKNLKAILIGVAAGALSCLTVLLVSCLVLHFDRNLTVSLLPKGITAAIGVSLTELFGGTPSITTLGISVTGIGGNMFGQAFCKLFRITDPIAQGVAFGTGSHVIGTAKASELSPLTGAVSSLSLVVAGLLTALLFPVIVNFL